jgi:PTS system mannose-specific IIB component
MAIKWIRIDDRLIHGQVATSWLRHVNAEQIICISDKAANNPVQIQVLKMAVPDIILHVFSVDHFIKVYRENPIRKSTFLLMESTLDALRLVEGGVDMPYINYGGMRSREGRFSYFHDLCFSKEEEDALYKLLDKGIKVEYQIAAFHAPTPLLEMIEKAKVGK